MLPHLLQEFFEERAPFEKTVAVAFHLDLRPRCNPVVNGHERLRCISAIKLFEKPRPTTDDFRHTLLKLGKLRRVYPDAIVARAIEQAAGFPPARSWDDVRLIRKVRGVLHDDNFDEPSDFCVRLADARTFLCRADGKEKPRAALFGLG